MATYRRIWVRATGCLLGAGLAVLGYLVIVAAPVLSAVLLVFAVAGLLARRKTRAESGGQDDGLLTWAAAQSVDVQAGMLVPVAVLACVGLSSALGVAGLQLLAFAGLAGLPLLVEHALRVLGGTSSAQWPWDSREGEPLRRSSATSRVVPLPREEDRAPAGAEPGPGDTSLAHLVDGLLDIAVERQAHPGPATPTSEAARSPGTLSTAELCHAWSASCRALAMSVHPGDRARIAAARARYLDALQERDPAGFARWVRSGQADHRDPSAYFVTPPT